MGTSWYPESFFNEFFWHQDPSVLEGFFCSWLPGYKEKDTCKVILGYNNMMSPALIKKQVLCWWRNRSGQFQRKEVSALPKLPLHSSSVIYPGLHHSTHQMSLRSSSPSWDVYRHTIHFSTQKINGHVAVLQVWKCIPFLWDKPFWNQVLPHDNLQGLKNNRWKEHSASWKLIFFRNCKMEKGGKSNFLLEFWWFGCLIYLHIYEDQVITCIYLISKNSYKSLYP